MSLILQKFPKELKFPYLVLKFLRTLVLKFLPVTFSLVAPLRWENETPLVKADIQTFD